MSYSYRAYGFGIDSEICIHGLESCKPELGDVQLRFESGPEPEWAQCRTTLAGRVRSRLPENKGTADPSFVLTEYGEGKCYELCYSDGTRFIVNGSADRVWGTIRPPLTSEDLATYFLGPVMGFLLRQRGVTCLHASGVELHGRGVLFAGGAGYGKSTTAAALALRGVPVLSEDIVPLELTEGCIWAVPGYPRVCLWPDAVEKLVGEKEALPKLTPMWEKRFLPLDGVQAKFSAEKKRLGLIYLLADPGGEESAPRIEEMRPREALLSLVQNTYMNWLLDRERRAEEFDALTKVVSEVPVRRIATSSDGAKIGRMCELIQADVEKVLQNS